MLAGLVLIYALCMPPTIVIILVSSFHGLQSDKDK